METITKRTKAYSKEEVRRIKEEIRAGHPTKQIAKALSIEFNRSFDGLLYKIYMVRLSMRQRRNGTRVTDSTETEINPVPIIQQEKHDEDYREPVKVSKRMILIEGISIEFDQLATGQRVEFYDDHFRIYFK